LMTLVGLTWFIVDLQFAPSRVAYTIGNLLGIVTYAVLAHLILAFPSGRLERNDDRVLAISVYAWMVIGNLLTETFFAPPPGPSLSPHILLVAHTDAAQNQVANSVQFSVNMLLGALTLSLLLVHWRAASHLGRRALWPALWSSLPLLTVVLALNLVNLFSSPAWLRMSLPVVTPLGLMTLPLAFLAGLVRTRLSRLSVGPLIVDLREYRGRDTLQAALARALDDPSLTIAYRMPGSSRWINAEGDAVNLPGPRDARSFTLLERSGTTVAALVHDRALDDDPSLIASVSAAASLALDNERLEAEVRARLAEVRASRVRILEAGDLAQRRLQRDIHDGAQQRLVALAIRLARLRDGREGEMSPSALQAVENVCDQLRMAIQDLRELSSGVHPALLVEAGLGPALQSLADSAAVPVRLELHLERRLPAPVETAAYFVVAESLANIGKHADAQSATVCAHVSAGRLVVSVEDDGCGGAEPGSGSGLPGLSDRVAALDGALAVVSPPGGGTRVVAELPCG
ncbi:MAG: sensor histidine kinase, partial [Chloroflexi bacterium]